MEDCMHYDVSQHYDVWVENELGFMVYKKLKVRYYVDIKKETFHVFQIYINYDGEMSEVRMTSEIKQGNQKYWVDIIDTTCINIPLIQRLIEELVIDESPQGVSPHRQSELVHRLLMKPIPSELLWAYDESTVKD